MYFFSSLFDVWLDWINSKSQHTKYLIINNKFERIHGILWLKLLFLFVRWVFMSYVGNFMEEKLCNKNMLQLRVENGEAHKRKTVIETTNVNMNINNERKKEEDNNIYRARDPMLTSKQSITNWIFDETTNI